MRRGWLIAILVPCLLGLVLLGHRGMGSAQAVPTPIGQLGGPVPLTPEERDTPTPGPTSTAATPENGGGSIGCDVAPLPVDEAIARLGQAGPSVPESAPGSSAADTNDAVVTTLRIFVACLNAGDYLRVAAITTPEFFASLVAGTGWTREELPAKLSALHPRDPDLTLRIVRTSVEVDQTGGKATATVTLLDPVSPWLGEADYWARFVQAGGAWLLADLQLVG
ncbi:MAG: hypothetical protein ACJ789_09080 [Thermomicrobiales bacterium]